MQWLILLLILYVDTLSRGLNTTGDFDEENRIYYVVLNEEYQNRNDGLQGECGEQTSSPSSNIKMRNDEPQRELNTYLGSPSSNVDMGLLYFAKYFSKWGLLQMKITVLKRLRNTSLGEFAQNWSLF